MGFYFHRIPSIAKAMYPGYIWSIPNDDKEIYLTFDDGPTPEVTDFVLNVLAEKKAKATFFCTGVNVLKHQSLSQQIIAYGHQLANHGYSHVSGWKTSKTVYLNNIQKGECELQTIINQDEFLFRPPYGHLRTSSKGIMWSLMSGDFDVQLSPEKCLSRLISKTRPGDIVVFHDNSVSYDKLKFVLPRYLQYCIDQGYNFGQISQPV